MPDGPNPYVYATGNPLLFTDPLGLARLVSFPPGEEQEVQRALADAINKLDKQPCCSGDKALSHDLSSVLDDPDLVITYDKTLPYCGETPTMGVVFGVHEFTLGPKAFNSAKCCDLASTLVHEAYHIGWGSEGGSRDIEKKCFNCPHPRK